jgi:hypothetical protein
MAGSIWPELTKEEQTEYLQRFHPHGYAEMLATVPNRAIRNSRADYSRSESVEFLKHLFGMGNRQNN